ncbi:hypothetical protein SU69_05700 [Thermosipho melanesiensis]|uniref:Uncharacterized protein n=2 Tax=Thermosipho melanesiensis TaxID=46541 RepID=A6LM22_THEM4|nr:hypothetical protein [Thermosipho melanesiensis]ABR30973.1 hypothetical protein Tmel_1118 [Thermosipho melanesiensis BI429]APT74071.1 hypothetical protein BW47_05990 [Thermosipho melanesiensis]OOC36016.1 hypothetical protein SU68_05760 [Thermosipho melanesiensis]OOC38155.1 hypothetical protein SU69_05700 [Thermosipho melanesiensis]OOC38284.1 hypothetical protein SU70_05710 [Thermosipho melanesiensis]
MDLSMLKKELSVKCKNGVAFLLSASVVWGIMLLIVLSNFEINTKNSLILWSTALLFPLAMVFSKIFKAQWKIDDNPLSILGFYLNIAQLIYYPIVVWALIKRPEEMIIFLGIITSAHLFPYGWYYSTKIYMVMSVFMSVTILFVALRLTLKTLWIIPTLMIVFLILLVILLYKDYKRKEKS